ncbi:MAG: hypothetical protein ACRD3N_11800 [Terracidiphilus sp.]
MPNTNGGLACAFWQPGGHARHPAAPQGSLQDEPERYRWFDMTEARVRFQGLLVRSCWLGLVDRVRAGLVINAMVAAG